MKSSAAFIVLCGCFTVCLAATSAPTNLIENATLYNAGFEYDQFSSYWDWSCVVCGGTSVTQNTVSPYSGIGALSIISNTTTYWEYAL